MRQIHFSDVMRTVPWLALSKKWFVSSNNNLLLMLVYAYELIIWYVPVDDRSSLFENRLPSGLIAKSFPFVE